MIKKLWGVPLATNTGSPTQSLSRPSRLRLLVRQSQYPVYSRLCTTSFWILVLMLSAGREMTAVRTDARRAETSRLVLPEKCWLVALLIY
jgi:hypothetical protein